MGTTRNSKRIGGYTMTICPRCWRVKLDDVLVRNALSRKDNKTYICNSCGQAEAMDDYHRYLIERENK